MRQKGGKEERKEGERERMREEWKEGLQLEGRTRKNKQKWR